MRRDKNKYLNMLRLEQFAFRQALSIYHNVVLYKNKLSLEIFYFNIRYTCINFICFNICDLFRI